MSHDHADLYKRLVYAEREIVRLEQKMDDRDADDQRNGDCGSEGAGSVDGHSPGTGEETPIARLLREVDRFDGSLAGLCFVRAAAEAVRREQAKGTRTGKVVGVYEKRPMIVEDDMATEQAGLREAAEALLMEWGKDKVHVMGDGDKFISALAALRRALDKTSGPGQAGADTMRAKQYRHWLHQCGMLLGAGEDHPEDIVSHLKGHLEMCRESDMDTARLNWLEERPRVELVHASGGTWTIYAREATGLPAYVITGQHETARAALDAARKVVPTSEAGGGKHPIEREA